MPHGCCSVSVSPLGGSSASRNSLEAVICAEAHQIIGIIEADSGNELARPQQVPLEFAVRGVTVKSARLQAVPQAQCRRDAHRLSAVGARRHRRASSRKRTCGCADDPAGQEQVGDVPAVQAAVRNLVDALGMPLRAAGLRAEHAVGRVQVDRPAAERHGIRMLPLLDDVLLT